MCKRYRSDAIFVTIILIKICFYILLLFWPVTELWEIVTNKLVVSHLTMIMGSDQIV